MARQADTTIGVRASTKARLFKLKESDSETYDDVLNRILDAYENQHAAESRGSEVEQHA